MSYLQDAYSVTTVHPAVVLGSLLRGQPVTSTMKLLQGLIKGLRLVYIVCAWGGTGWWLTRVACRIGWPGMVVPTLHVFTRPTAYLV